MREAIPPLPHYVFMAWCSVKHRDNFTLIINKKMDSGCGYGTITSVDCLSDAQYIEICAHKGW
jgi:hypothetical protein